MEIKKVIAIQNISVYNFLVVSRSIVDMEMPLKYTQCACAILLLMHIYSFCFGACQSFCMYTKAGTSLITTLHRLTVSLKAFYSDRALRLPIQCLNRLEGQANQYYKHAVKSNSE